MFLPFSKNGPKGPVFRLLGASPSCFFLFFFLIIMICNKWEHLNTSAMGDMEE